MNTVFTNHHNMSYFQRRSFFPRTLLLILRFLGLKKKYSRRNKESDLEQITFTKFYDRKLTKEEMEAEFDKFNRRFRETDDGNKIKLKFN